MSEIQIDANFPAGNIIVDRIEGSHAWVRQDLRDTEGQWFYWNCRVRDFAAGEAIQLTFTDGDVIGVHGPAVSDDGGETWRWLGAESVSRDGQVPTIIYAPPPGATEVRLSFCFPYTNAHWQSWLASLPAQSSRGGAKLQILHLGESRQGRPFEAVQFIPAAKPAAQVLLTSRHHCCETSGTFTVEGFVAAWCADDELGTWLREHVHLTAIPFMDVDGVENGDQGKNRRPHDHNRDYGTDNSKDALYPEVRALREFLPGWLPNCERNFALDIHCPWIRGDYHEHVYFVGQSEPRVQPAARRFSALLESLRTGPLPYEASGDLPYGQGWNAAGNYKQALSSCTARLNSFPEMEFASSLEVPYANAGGVTVTPDSARALGRDLAAALRAYLED